MKKIFISLLFYFVSINLYASEIKFEKIVDGLNNPWSLSFVNEESPDILCLQETHINSNSKEEKEKYQKLKLLLKVKFI